MFHKQKQTAGTHPQNEAGRTLNRRGVGVATYLSILEFIQAFAQRLILQQREKTQ